MKKKIEHILAGREKQITEHDKVRQPLPHKDFRFASPFILLHHLGPDTVAPGQKIRIDPHPHRGFAPTTFMLQGEGYHKDSAGHDETVKAGDVQMMFAGKGLLHSEGPSENMLKTGGEYELLQLWVNVPKAHKWDEPTYQAASKAEQPAVLEQEGVLLRLACGTYDGKTGPVKTHTPIISIFGEIAQGKQVQFTATPGYWTLLYVAKGTVTANQETIPQFSLAVFEKANDGITLTAEADSTILFLSGEPIDEPVAAKDNFVMNTMEEADQAIQDYKNGLFGELAF